MTRGEELQAIDAAIKAGRLHRVPMGATSNWDDIPFRERRAIVFDNWKKPKLDVSAKEEIDDGV